MAKRTIQSEAAVSAEPRKARASTSRTAAAAHKHTAKKVAEVPEELALDRPRVSNEDIARLAYSYWEARGFQGGSPEADWFRAEQALLKLS